MNDDELEQKNDDKDVFKDKIINNNLNNINTENIINKLNYIINKNETNKKNHNNEKDEILINTSNTNNEIKNEEIKNDFTGNFSEDNKNYKKKKKLKIEENMNKNKNSEKKFKNLENFGNQNDFFSEEEKKIFDNRENEDFLHIFRNDETDSRKESNGNIDNEEKNEKENEDIQSNIS